MTKCPVCGIVSPRSYRCPECGKDLTDVDDDDDGPSAPPAISCDGGRRVACDGGTETSAEAGEQSLSKMERDRREHNQRVRQRDACRVCEGDVPEEDFSEKYAAAGGCLTGPFCSGECYWRWMNA